MADAALAKLAAIFVALYSETGPSAIAPTRLLKSTLLMALFGLRDAAMFCSLVADNAGLRWFLSMVDGEKGFDPALFRQGQTRLDRNRVAREFFIEIVEQASSAGLIDEAHFCVDRARIDAWRECR